MKKTALLLVLLLLSVDAYSQIKEFVFVVRPDYNSETNTFLKGVAEALEAEGYDGLAEEQNDREGGRFGSGFLYVAADGVTYAVTNRHVVDGADSVVLQQEMRDGTLKTYEDNRIAAVDDGLDLALVRIADADRFSEGLGFADTVPTDGTDVWSAGYPGLGGDPSWQFGKGNITNFRARIEELVDPEKSTLIQHSAPVDPGNSGGPLLVETESGAYHVVGVNTWKAFSRQAANFAMPAEAVRAFIQSSVSAVTDEQLKMLLTERAEEFAAVVSNDDLDEKPAKKIDRISSFISTEYVHEYGEDALIDVFRYAPRDVRSKVIRYAANSSLLEAMRLASAYSVYAGLEDNFGEDMVLFHSGGADGSGDDHVEYRFSTAEGETLYIQWIVENRSWRIVSTDFTREAAKTEPEAERATAKYSFEEPYRGQLFVEYSYINDLGGIFGGGVLSGSQYFSGGASVLAGSVDVEEPDYGTSTSLLVRMLFVGRLQFPVVSDTFILNPFGEVRGGFQMAPDTISQSGLIRSIGLGVEFGYSTQNVTYMLGLSWKSDKVLMSLINEGEDITQSSVSLSLGIGVY